MRCAVDSHAREMGPIFAMEGATLTDRGATTTRWRCDPGKPDSSLPTATVLDVPS